MTDVMSASAFAF